MAKLSKDIFPEILMRLPIKPLVQFKCVSKQWHSLILNPPFIRSQLQCALSRKPHLSTRVLLANCPLKSISIESLSDPNVEAPPTTVLKLPVKIPRECVIDVVGSCNGLVCLHVSGKGLIVLNPTTGDCRELPNSKVAPWNNKLFYGFGYDTHTDDYKVVWGCPADLGGGANSNQTSIVIFSLRTNSCRCLLEGTELRNYNRGVYASGCLHWLMSGSASEPVSRIISFDLSAEKFHEIVTVPMTATDDLESVLLEGLVVTGECLFVYRRLTTHFEAWVMKLEGKETSWTKWCSFPMDVMPVNRYCWFHPIAFTQDGNIISAELVLYLYNFKENAIRRFDFDEDEEESYFGSATYIESLVSPYSDTQSVEDEEV
ncbi:F-box/kelch-repeat protein At3g06240-like [Punica granatum]|uniref:F-box domain-containing protein n=2 Tax=Punica granatum TaxID=22663 RepID=A0A218W5F3_PUNGR|nr:F-box/kelch-repeat protein At3g06240-like [Punica granatum]OWM68087.1 hypothetical protein CDL15_Pgr016287 [Punica granatum]PKI71905.1 hypothetical protein CRG98_007673 [Punica granatum]